MQSGESRISCVMVCYTRIRTLVSPIFEAINMEKCTVIARFHSSQINHESKKMWANLY